MLWPVDDIALFDALLTASRICLQYLPGVPVVRGYEYHDDGYAGVAQTFTEYLRMNSRLNYQRGMSVAQIVETHSSLCIVELGRAVSGTGPSHYQQQGEDNPKSLLAPYGFTEVEAYPVSTLLTLLMFFRRNRAIIFLPTPGVGNPRRFNAS